jgi:hypothetical protein
MTTQRTVYEIADGEVVLWTVDGTIHIKTISKYNDPVELSEVDAIELSQLLVRLVKEG